MAVGINLYVEDIRRRYYWRVGEHGGENWSWVVFARSHENYIVRSIKIYSLFIKIFEKSI